MSPQSHEKERFWPPKNQVTIKPCKDVGLGAHGSFIISTRWAPISYKLKIDNRVITRLKWPYEWVTGVPTLLLGAITAFPTGSRPPCRYYRTMTYTSGFYIH